MLAVPNLSTVLGRRSWECGHAMSRLQGRVLAGSAGKCRIMVRRFYSMLYHRRGFYPPGAVWSVACVFPGSVLCCGWLWCRYRRLYFLDAAWVVTLCDTQCIPICTWGP